jgi:hypothetical protein
MKQSEKTDVLNKALLKVHYEIGPIIELDRENPAFYKKDTGKGHGYASIGAVLKKIKPIANEHGLIIEQYPKFLVKSTASVPNGITTGPSESSWTTDVVRKEEFSKDAPLLLATRITHGDSGQWKEIDYPVRVKDENDPQKLKSGHTYARRDSLELLFNVAESDDDDDGNLASEQKASSSSNGSSNTGKAGKRSGSSKRPNYQSTGKVKEIENQIRSSLSKDDLAETINKLQEVDKETKISPWDEIDKEGQDYLAIVWEKVEKKLPESTPKTDDEIKDEIPF